MLGEVVIYRAAASSSLVLKGLLNETPCEFVVDTGATRTIVSIALVEQARLSLQKG